MNISFLPMSRNLPFISVLVGIAVLTVTEVVLLYTVGIYGAPISSVVCYLIVMLMDIYFLRKYCGVRLNLGGMFARPLACGAISTVVTYGAYVGAKALWRALVGANTDSRVAAFVILLISGIALVIAYSLSSLVLSAIKEDEVRLLPMGNKIADFLIKRNWLKRSSIED